MTRLANRCDHFNLANRQHQRWQLWIETQVLKNAGHLKTQPFCQTQNPGLTVDDIPVLGLCFFGCVLYISTADIRQFNAFFTTGSQTVQMSVPVVFYGN